MRYKFLFGFLAGALFQATVGAFITANILAWLHSP